MEGHCELKIYLLRSLVNWGTLLELFTNLEADLVCLQRHLCGNSMLAQLLSLYIKTQTLNVRFHSSPSLTISMVGLVFASTFLYNFVFPGVFDISSEPQNLPDHPGHAHGCEVLFQTLTLLVLENPNCLLHLDCKSLTHSWERFAK